VSSLLATFYIDFEKVTIDFFIVAVFTDLALQYAAMCLRTEGMFAIGTSLGPIGWRVRKQYFKVTEKAAHRHAVEKAQQKRTLSKSGSTSKSDSVENEAGSHPKDHSGGKEEFILSWSEYGPDKYIEEKEIHNVFKNLSSIQHPYIQNIECLAANDNGALVIRK
jgi:PX domain-containing protein kinase-like protein